MNILTNFITFYFISQPIATCISSLLINYIGINIYIAPQCIEITTIFIVKPIHYLITYQPIKLLKFL
jgi:hypothetical protein